MLYEDLDDLEPLDTYKQPEPEDDDTEDDNRNVSKDKKRNAVVRTTVGAVSTQAAGPVVGGIVGGALDARNEYTKEGDVARAASVGISATAGTGIGATLGAAVGTAVCPGPGSVVGGIAGSMLGGFFGKKTGKVIVPKKEEESEGRYDGYKDKLATAREKISGGTHKTDEEILEDVQKSDAHFADVMTRVQEEDNPFSGLDFADDVELESSLYKL